MADGLPVCSDFLKINVITDYVMWELHLAVQFDLDDLKIFCVQKIRQSYKFIIDTIGFDNGRLRVVSDNRLLNTEMANILSHVFSVYHLEEHHFKLDVKVLPMEYVPITLAAMKIAPNAAVKNTETIQFPLDITMMLAVIFFA